MRTAIICAIVGFAALASSAASASCTCTCQDGQNRPVCTQPTDIPPMCPVQMCRTDVPSTTSLQPAQPGKTCRRTMIANSAGNYVPQTVCK